MSFSTGAWIGIGVGLVLAVFDYVLMLHVVRRGMQKGDSQMDERKLGTFKMFLAFGFVFFPVMGYVLGNMLVEQGLLPR